jgi:hypothetical protein
MGGEDMSVPLRPLPASTLSCHFEAVLVMASEASGMLGMFRRRLERIAAKRASAKIWWQRRLHKPSVLPLIRLVCFREGDGDNREL